MNQSVRYATASETGLDGNTIIYQNYLYLHLIDLRNYND